MRTVKVIEMVDDSNIYGIRFGKSLIIKPSQDNEKYYEVWEGNDCIIDNADSIEEAEKEAKNLLIDDHLIISGYGKYSGRKFWQLPEEVKEFILSMAINADEPKKEPVKPIYRTNQMRVVR